MKGALVIRTALDSDDLSVFKPPADFILTYSDLVIDAAAFEREYPGVQVVYIDRGIGDPDDKATIIDAETGAYRTDQVAEWYDRKAAKKAAYLTYYANRSNLLAIEADIGGRHMYRWVATLDGTIVIPGFSPLRGPDLVQTTSAAQLGFHADFSLVLNPGWHPSPDNPKLAQMNTIAADASRDLSMVAGRLSSLEAMVKSMQ
jgi:hypothetical protein